MRWGRRILGALFVLFLLFYLINQPVSAANAVRAVFAALARAFNSLLGFFRNLTRWRGRVRGLWGAQGVAGDLLGLGPVVHSARPDSVRVGQRPDGVLADHPRRGTHRWTGGVEDSLRVPGSFRGDQSAGLPGSRHLQRAAGERAAEPDPGHHGQETVD